MQRTLLGVLLALGLFGALVYMTIAQADVRCEVCIVFQGRQACEAATAPDREQAQLQATATACSMLTGGVTESIRCSKTLPQSLYCDDGGP